MNLIEEKKLEIAKYESKLDQVKSDIFLLDMKDSHSTEDKETLKELENKKKNYENFLEVDKKLLENLENEIQTD